MEGATFKCPGCRAENPVPDSEDRTIKVGCPNCGTTTVLRNKKHPDAVALDYLKIQRTPVQKVIFVALWVGNIGVYLLFMGWTMLHIGPRIYIYPILLASLVLICLGLVYYLNMIPDHVVMETASFSIRYRSGKGLVQGYADIGSYEVFPGERMVRVSMTDGRKVEFHYSDVELREILGLFSANHVKRIGDTAGNPQR